MKYLPDGISLKTALLGLFAIVTFAAVGHNYGSCLPMITRSCARD